MADKTKEPLGCTGCFYACAAIFLIGYGIFFVCSLFLGPGGWLANAGSIILLLLFMGCLKLFSGK